METCSKMLIVLLIIPKVGLHRRPFQNEGLTKLTDGFVSECSHFGDAIYKIYY